jgi:hypothetical protein
MLVVVAIAVSAALALGYFGHDYLNVNKMLVVSKPFPDVAYKPASLDLGCSAIMTGTAYEDRFEHSANVRVEHEGAKLALRISPDRKKAYVLYAFDVSNGVTEPVELDVESATSSYIVAHGAQLVGGTSIILDMKTYKAVVNYTGQGLLGIKGGSVLAQCH